MITKKFMPVLLSVFIATWLLSSVSQTMAETGGKNFPAYYEGGNGSDS